MCVCVITFQPAVTPTLTAVVPAQAAGSATLTVSGTHFTADTRVYVGAAPCDPVVLVTDTTLTCPAPLMPAGAYPIRVVVPSLGVAQAQGLVTFTSI